MKKIKRLSSYLIGLITVIFAKCLMLCFGVFFRDGDDPVTWREMKIILAVEIAILIAILIRILKFNYAVFG